MKPIFKPYRLVNTIEIASLWQRLAAALTDWNKLYAAQDLQLELETAAPYPPFGHLLPEGGKCLLVVKQAKKPLALVDENYLSLIKDLVFFDSSACFDSVCEDLFKRLLKQLLELNHREANQSFEPQSLLLAMAEQDDFLDQWFYPGSPCLRAKFGNEQQHFNLYLHPDWVLTHLARKNSPRPALTRLEDALADKELFLTVELEPLVLSLQTLSQLQIGDVIKTSHLLDKPLDLNHQQERIAGVIPGQQEQRRSVLIDAKKV